MPGLDIRRSRRAHAGAERENEYALAQPTVAGTEEGIGGEQGLGSALRRFITAGLYNSDFGQLPEDLTMPIDDQNNPLPYWSFVRAAGEAVTAQVVADAASASGYVLRFAMGPGVAGDAAYIEQIIPINGSRSQSFYYRPMLAVLTAASVNNMRLTLATDWLAIDGVTVLAAAATSGTTTSAIGAATVADFATASYSTPPPAAAYYLRVRFGFARDIEVVGASGQVDFCEASVDIGGAAVFVTERDAPATYNPAVLYQSNGSLFILPNLGATGFLEVNGATGSLRITGALHLLSDETLTGTGTQSDVALAARTTVCRWNGASAATFTGLTNGLAGRVVILANVTAAQTLTLSHDVTSTAANRFYCPNGASYTLAANSAVTLVYDATLSRWRVIDSAPAFSKGTSFPASPATDDLFYRTDVDLLCFYDGTRWLTVAEYTLDFNWFTASATGEQTYGALLDVIGAVYITNFAVAFFVNGGATALGAANLWTVALTSNVGAAATTRSTITINSGASAVWRSASNANVNVALGTTVNMMSIVSTKTGTPGNCVTTCLMTYRRIIT